MHHRLCGAGSKSLRRDCEHPRLWSCRLRHRYLPSSFCMLHYFDLLLCSWLLHTVKCEMILYSRTPILTVIVNCVVTVQRDHCSNDGDGAPELFPAVVHLARNSPAVRRSNWNWEVGHHQQFPHSTAERKVGVLRHEYAYTINW